MFLSIERESEKMKLIDQYRKMHKKGRFSGWSLKKHLKEIEKLLQITDSQTVLDYGCGKAKHHPEGWDKYEPALEEWSSLSNGPYDAVICTDVLEHVPEDELNENLKNIFDRATKMVFLSIATKPAKKNLPNGDNAHCTVKDPTWWHQKITPFVKDQMVTIHYD